MGSPVYSFLNDSLLFDVSLTDQDYSSISDARLLKELKSYRNFCIDNLPNITSDIRHDGNILSCLGSTQYSDLDTLKRSALYLEQVVLTDPIFPFTELKSQISNTMSQLLGMKTNNHVNRKSLALAATKMISMRPMVAGGYVKYYPISYHAEAPIHIPVGYSENAFSDVLPPSILEFFRNRANVKSLEKTDDGFVVKEDLTLGRSIGIWFKDADEKQINTYNLIKQEVLSADEDTRIVEFKMILPDSPPDKEQFRIWVKQSVNRSAQGYFDELTKEVSLAHHLQSIYTCDSVLDSELLSSSFFNSRSGVKENAIECLLKMELPFIYNIGSEDLMNIRLNDGEEFQAFRIELEKQFRELRHENNPEVIKEKILDIEHEMTEVQVRNIDSKIRSVRKVALADTGLAIAGVAAGIATSGVSLIGSLAGFLHGCKTYSEYQEKVKENPCYFLWGLKKMSRGSSYKQKNSKYHNSNNKQNVTSFKATNSSML